MNSEFEQWLTVTTFLPGYTPINGVTTNLMEIAFSAGEKSEREKLIHKLQEMRRLGQQDDDSTMANKAQAVLTWIENDVSLHCHR